jgi:hypothetical protein
VVAECGQREGLGVLPKLSLGETSVKVCNSRLLESLDFNGRLRTAACTRRGCNQRKHRGSTTGKKHKPPNDDRKIMIVKP